MTLRVDEQTSARTLERELASYQAITRRLDAYALELEGEMRQARTSLHLAQAVIDILPDPLLVVERSCRIVQLNQAAAELFGFTSAVLGRAQCPSALKCYRCFGESCPLKPGARLGERQMQLAGPEGETCTYSISATPLPGNDACVVLLFRDITEMVALIDGALS